jgi:Protein of unknown function (DUF2809)
VFNAPIEAIRCATIRCAGSVQDTWRGPRHHLEAAVKRRLGYLGLAAACLAVCVAIVVWFEGQPLVRGVIGDAVVVALLYFLARAVVDSRPRFLATAVLTVAFLVEFGQYFAVLKLLGVRENWVTRIVFGSVFDYRDLLAYTAGVALAYTVDTKVLAGRICR